MKLTDKNLTGISDEHPSGPALAAQDAADENVTVRILGVESSAIHSLDINVDKGSFVVAWKSNPDKTYTFDGFDGAGLSLLTDRMAFDESLGALVSDFTKNRTSVEAREAEEREREQNQEDLAAAIRYLDDGVSYRGPYADERRGLALLVDSQE